MLDTFLLSLNTLKRVIHLNVTLSVPSTLLLNCFVGGSLCWSHSVVGVTIKEATIKLIS